MRSDKREKIKSSHVRFGRRTYFFDVISGMNDRKYLKVTESKFMGEGKDHLYNSFLLFPEDIVGFKQNFDEAASLLSV
ncbi:MAG TPA: DUF3276 family protein [Patescibacteria group bacterium]|nr:DUF3276 family protein [Patescibacteria group bacterium]